MQTLEIAWEDIPSIAKTELILNPSINLDNKFYSHIYDLGVKFPTTGDRNYIIKLGNDPLAYKETYATNFVKEYAKFGYYFVDGNKAVLQDDIIENRLLVIEEKDIVDHETFIEFIKSKSNDVYTHVLFLIEANLSEDSSSTETTVQKFKNFAKQYAEYVSSENPLIIVNSFPAFRDNISVISSMTLKELYGFSAKGKKVFSIVDITNEIMNVIPSNLVNYDSSINGMLKVIERFSKIEPNSRVIYNLNFNDNRIDRNNKAIVESIYLGLSAYISCKYGHVFFCEPYMLDQYLVYLRDLVSQERNSLADYLNMVNSPLSVAVGYRAGSMFIQKLDYEKRNLSIGNKEITYIPRVTMLAMEFNPTDLNFSNTTDTNIFELKLGTFTIIDHSEYYDTKSSDKDVAISNDKELSKLMYKFETLARKTSKGKSLPKNILLDLTNCMFFKYKDKYYFGHMMSLIGKYPYICKPVCTGYADFRMDIDVSIIQQLLPANIIYAYELYILKQLPDVLKKRALLNLPDSALGIVDSLISSSYRNSETKNDLTFDQIGMWSQSTTSFRGQSGEKLFEQISPLALRKNNQITSYGGLHPFNSSVMVLRNSSWREK